MSTNPTPSNPTPSNPTPTDHRNIYSPHTVKRPDILPDDFQWESYTPTAFYSEYWKALAFPSVNLALKYVIRLEEFLTVEQRINLIRLAAYLHRYASIPSSIAECESKESSINLDLMLWKKSHAFNMMAFCEERLITLADGGDYLVNECGSVGCVAGHGPYAGIPKTHENWYYYTKRCFGASCPSLNRYANENHNTLWNWVFSANWRWIDNTPEGAARRIDFALVYGVPKDAEVQHDGKALLYYIPPARSA